MKSSYLRSSACCWACASSRRVSNFSWAGSRTMGVITFIGKSFEFFQSPLRRVDALMRRDAVAGHRLPHAEFEYLHVERMQDVGDEQHRIRDGDAAAVGWQGRAHPGVRLHG